VLVFAEGRFVSSCAPPLEVNGVERYERLPNEQGGLELRRSLDGGSTWLSTQTIYSGNIDFYTVVWDSHSNTIYLMLEAASANAILIFTSTNEVEFSFSVEIFEMRIYFRENHGPILYL